MNTKVMNEMIQKTLAAQITFGDVVAMMIAEGVESYRADLVRKETTFYMPDGQTHVVPLPLEDHALAQKFSAEGVQSALKTIQRGEIGYREFIRRALDSGVSNYIVYFKGRKVVYAGRDGDSYTEHFPQQRT